MAPTICDDEHDVSHVRRTRKRIMKNRNSTQISYAGRRLYVHNMYANDSTLSSESSNSGSTSTSNGVASSGLSSHEYRDMIERNNRQNLLRIDDDLIDSCSRSSFLSDECSTNSATKDDIECNVENAHNRSRCTSHVIDDDASLSSMPSTPSTSTSSLYDDLNYTRRHHLSPHPEQLAISSLPSPSSVASSDALPSLLMYRLTAQYHALPRRSQNRGLLEIAIKTVKLLQKNRTLQARLDQLQVETRQFVDSVMANPENCDLRDRIKYNIDDSTTVAQTLGIGH